MYQSAADQSFHGPTEHNYLQFCWLTITTYCTKTGVIFERQYRSIEIINFIENMQISNYTVCGFSHSRCELPLHKHPATEGIDVICHHYEKHYEHNLPISTNSYGNFYGSYSKRIISNLRKDTSYKHKASLWELRWQLLSLLFLWQTEKKDC